MSVEQIAVRPRSRLRRWLGQALRWLAPGVGLALVPKCPMCLAAYLALFTGISVSRSFAEGLRIGLMVVCVAAFAWLLIGKLRRSH